MELLRFSAGNPSKGEDLKLFFLRLNDKRKTTTKKKENIFLKLRFLKGSWGLLFFLPETPWAIAGLEKFSFQPEMLPWGKLTRPGTFQKPKQEQGFYRKHFCKRLIWKLVLAFFGNIISIETSEKKSLKVPKVFSHRTQT